MKIEIPHNRIHPIEASKPCYLCGGEWREFHMAMHARRIIGIGTQPLARCNRCGLVTCVKKANQK